MKVKVHRKAHFNAAHRLYRVDWSADHNAAVFGLCSNPYYHGHNYELIVQLEGVINPETGFVVDLKWLKEVIREEVTLKLDHKNLNEEVEEFNTLNPTAEYISVVIWRWLRPHIPEHCSLEVTLYETPRNYVIYSGDEN